FQPIIDLNLGLTFNQSLEPGKVDQLIPNLHFFVEPPLLRQIADLSYVIRGKFFSIDLYRSAVLLDDLIDDTDQRSLAGTVWAQKSKDHSLWHKKVHVGKSPVIFVGFI